jgi:hypothetical protein
MYSSIHYIRTYTAATPASGETRGVLLAKPGDRAGPPVHWQACIVHAQACVSTRSAHGWHTENPSKQRKPRAHPVTGVTGKLIGLFLKKENNNNSNNKNYLEYILK